jgi:uncharacterized protein (TIGR02145 family)
MSVTDIDGNIYQTVVIGTQEWSVESLKTNRLNDGTNIPIVTTGNFDIITPLMCYYDNDRTTNEPVYGALYNWYAVNTGILAPVGWRVPTIDDWVALSVYLGGDSVSGGKLKETGFTHWTSPNVDATNELGFTGRPTGYRMFTGVYFDKTLFGHFQCSTQFGGNTAFGAMLSYNSAVLTLNAGFASTGKSVRFMRDIVVPTPALFATNDNVNPKLIHLTWTATGSTYRVESSINDPTFQNVNVVYTGSNTSVDNIVPMYATTYYYRVRVETPIQSSWSNVAVASTRLDGHLLTFLSATKRHVAKAFDISNMASVSLTKSFGEFEISGSDDSHFNQPVSMTKDSDNNFYVCDTLNQRIIKLSNAFVYVSSYSTAATIGYPFSIYLGANGDLYAAGHRYHIIENDVVYVYVGVQRLTTLLTNVKYNDDILGPSQRITIENIDAKGSTVCKGFNASEVLILGIGQHIYKTTETAGGFSTAILSDVTNENTGVILSALMHSNGFLYACNGKKIFKINSSFARVSNSVFKSVDQFGSRHHLQGLSEDLNGGILTYDSMTQQIVRLSHGLSFIEAIIADTGSTIDTDNYDIRGIIELVI